MSAVVIAAIASMASIVGVTVWTQWAMRRDLRNYMRKSAEWRNR